jgi:DNA-binding PucR family transcriptional regulator
MNDRTFKRETLRRAATDLAEAFQEAADAEAKGDFEAMEKADQKGVLQLVVLSMGAKEFSEFVLPELKKQT